MPYSRHPQSLHALLDWWDKNNVAWYFFWGKGGGAGGNGWFGLCKNFFPKPLGIEFFITLHAALFTMKNIFSLVKDVFFLGGGGRYFLVFRGITHITHPHPPSKVKWSAPNTSNRGWVCSFYQNETAVWWSRKMYSSSFDFVLWGHLLSLLHPKK